ncbi:MAG: lytic transglycosylase domain-containing protein [Rhodomicrobium sp.]
MSTPPGRTPAPRDPFKLLSAILTGLVLGFFAVMLFQQDLPQQSPRQMLAQASAAAQPPLAKGAVLPPAPAVKAATPVKQAQPEPSPAKPAEMAQTPDRRPAPEDVKAPSKVSGEAAAPAAPEPAKASAAEVPVPAKPAPPPAPAPVSIPASSARPAKSLSADEMTAALQPLLSFRIGDEDAKAVKEAVEAASREDDGDARAAINKIVSPAARNFAEWKRWRNPQADFQESLAFRVAHPLYPDLPQDGTNEKNLFLSNAPAAAVLKFYTNRNPLTGAGHGSLGGALMEAGERERGLAMIKFAWGRYMLDPAVEEKFRSRFGALLDEQDRRRREQLVAIHAAYKEDPGKDSETRGKGLRAALKLKAKKGRNGGSHRALHRNRRRRADGENGTRWLREAAALGKARQLGVASLVEPVRYRRISRKTASGHNKDEDGKKPADEGSNTRQAKAAANAFKLTREVRGGPGTLLSRLKALRRENADDDLWSLLRSLDPNSADLADPDHWFDFRRSEVRRALIQDHPKTAYAIASVHGPLDAENLSNAEFMAGWVALRFVHDPLLAVPHFKASRITGFPRTEARAAYWLGRAKLETGAAKEAQRYFAEAATRFYTFYGALARQALYRDNTCEFRAPTAPSERAIAAFVNEDAFKAVMIAKQLDLDSVLKAFILDLSRQIRDPEQMTLVMELAQRVTGPHVAVHAAKVALLRGFAVEAYAFPALLPKYGEAGGNAKVEPAILSALTRQESEFFTGTVSPVGARGLMQLMPQTARQVAVSAKMKYDLGRLSSDPSYNVTLGSAFFAQLLSGYDGSYVLTLAAYNAGPSRVVEWIKQLGDPRDKDVDPIDWVERLPYIETRQYIQKILESTQLYRCGFENRKAGFRLVEDLHRGRPGKIPEPNDIAGSSGADETP